MLAIRGPHRSGWEFVRRRARRSKHMVGVEHSVRIGRSLDEVTSRLLGGSQLWFPNSVGFHVAGLSVKKRVVVQCGQLVATTTWAAVRFTLKATRAERFFPGMLGRLTFESVGQGETTLSLATSYTPPFGRIGERLNEIALHHIAAKSIRELAQAIAERLESSSR